MNNNLMIIFQIITPFIVVIISSIIPMIINLLLTRSKDKNSNKKAVDRELMENLYIPMTNIFQCIKDPDKAMESVARDIRCLFNKENHLVSDDLSYNLSMLELEINIEKSTFEKIKPLLTTYFEDYHKIRRSLGYPYSVAIEPYVFRKKCLSFFNVLRIVNILVAIGYTAYYLFNFYYYGSIPTIWQMFYIPDTISAFFVNKFGKKKMLMRLNDKSMIELWLDDYEHMCSKRDTEICTQLARQNYSKQ